MSDEGSDGEGYTIDKLDSLSAKKRLKQSRRSATQEKELDPKRIAVSAMAISML